MAVVMNGRAPDAGSEAGGSGERDALAPWLSRMDALSDAELSAATTAALKSWAARCELRARSAPVIDAQATTATEVVVVVSELIRAAGLNLFDVAMWYRRPQGDAERAADAHAGGARG